MQLDTIICGDNCDVLGTFPRECIDLVVTSPPYDNLRIYGGHSWDFYGVAWQLKRVLKPGGVIVWIVADETSGGSETGTSFEQALHFKRSGMKLLDTMIWEKTGQGAVGSTGGYWQNFEFMFVFSNGDAKTFNPICDRRNAITSGKAATCGARSSNGEYRSKRVVERTEFGRRFNTWRIEAQRLSEHPAPFPEALARDHILSWSNEGDIVLDPFVGSGTTTKMARLMGRRFIGIDVNEDYCEIARKRLAQKLLPFDGDKGHVDATT